MIKAAKKTNNQSASTPDSLSILYLNTPDFNCNMSQIENYCMDRFNLLNEVLSLKDTSNKTTTSAPTSGGIVDNNEFYELSKKYLGSQKEELFRIKDDLSHFCLRIAMCDSYDKDWFIAAETALLSHRLPSDPTSILTLFKGFGWSAVSQDEYLKYADDLNYLVVKSNLNLQDQINSSHFYKIPFQDIPKLVETKKVILIKGYAYIFKSNFKDLILHTFKNFMEYALSRVKVDKSRIREQFPDLVLFFKSIPRVDQLRGNANRQYFNAAHIRKEDILPLSRTSFPLCMKVMHDGLLSIGKLKHEGRLEFSTFLKGIGLPYEEAIHYWKMSMSKRVSSTEFDKDYAYTFRHTYGLEGKSISYSPYSCVKIIAKIPNGIDQIHGCPYALSTERLDQKLEELGVAEFERIQIIESTKTSPNVACTKHFNLLHPNNQFSKIISHPNSFFENSRLYYKSLADLKDKKSLNDKDQSTTNNNPDKMN